MSRKHGVITYKENPFITPTTAISTSKKRVVVQGGKAIVDQTTGEMENVAEVVMIRQVDSEQFVKLFTQNLKVFFDLTPGTMKLLQVLLAQVQKNANQDRVMLNVSIMQDYFLTSKTDALSKASFHRSVKELIEKRFIAETVLTGLYYINPNLFFNGDRVRFMTEIRRSKSAQIEEGKKSADAQRVEIILDEVKSLSELAETPADELD
jgi:hypothetical protein